MNNPTVRLTCSVTRMGHRDWFWFVSDPSGSILRRGGADTREAARDFARRAREKLLSSEKQRELEGDE